MTTRRYTYVQAYGAPTLTGKQTWRISFFFLILVFHETLNIILPIHWADVRSNRLSLIFKLYFFPSPEFVPHYCCYHIFAFILTYGALLIIQVLVFLYIKLNLSSLALVIILSFFFSDAPTRCTSLLTSSLPVTTLPRTFHLALWTCCLCITLRILSCSLSLLDDLVTSISSAFRPLAFGSCFLWGGSFFG